jgi:hypothetical protein
MDQLNEFNSVLSVMSAPAMALGSAVADLQGRLATADASTPYVAPVQQDAPPAPPQPKYKNIYVSPACFEQASNTPDGMTVFNLVFDVSYTDENDSYKRFKVAKQISICPDKLACEASQTQPIQVIENKSEIDAMTARLVFLGGK